MSEVGFVWGLLFVIWIGAPLALGRSRRRSDPSDPLSRTDWFLILALLACVIVVFVVAANHFGAVVWFFLLMAASAAVMWWAYTLARSENT